MLKSVSKLRLLVDETRDAYLRGDVNYTIELDGIAERIEQEVSERYMELPLDADGVPIRVGDVLTDGDHYEDGTVAGIQFYEMANGGIRTLIAVRPDGWDVATWHTPDEYRRHHKQPTVEDVLRDMLDSLDLDPTSHVDTGAVIAGYAQRLQLREVDE